MDVESCHCVLVDLFEHPLGTIFRRVIRRAVSFFEFLFSPFDIFPSVCPNLFCCDVFQELLLPRQM